MKPIRRTRFFAALLLLLSSAVCSAARLQSGEIRVWQMQEITFEAERDYPNPYTDVDVWIELKGPGFERRVYGFWDGGRTFKVRFVATAPGEWTWRSASNRSDDAGLNGFQGVGDLHHRAAVAFDELNLVLRAFGDALGHLGHEEVLHQIDVGIDRRMTGRNPEPDVLLRGRRRYAGDCHAQRDG